MPPSNGYWFPAKAYGWGWGLPLTWQGWLVLVAYAVGMAVLGWQVDPATRPVGFVIGVTVLSAALVVVCWKTGEPPRWRWGGR